MARKQKPGEEWAELRDLRGDQFARVESDLLRDDRIPYGHKALYALLITYGPQRVMPSQGTLGECLGVKRETVNRWLSDLKAWGIITWRRRQNTSNLYAILGYERSIFAEVIPDAHQDEGVILESHRICADTDTVSDPEGTLSRSIEPDPLNESWNICLAELEMQTTRTVFADALWGSELLSLTTDRAVIRARDKRALGLLTTPGWTTKITRTLAGVTGQERMVEFVVEETE